MKLSEMKISGRYKWKSGDEILIYIGCNFSGNGFWHQFVLESVPGKVWYEVADSDLPLMEELFNIRSQMSDEMKRLYANDAIFRGCINSSIQNNLSYVDSLEMACVAFVNVLSKNYNNELENINNTAARSLFLMGVVNNG